MKIVNALVAVVALSSGVAMAAGKKDHGTLNCDAAGKKFHAKNKAACEKKKGTWSEEAAAAAPAAAAPAAAPDATTPAPEEHK